MALGPGNCGFLRTPGRDDIAEDTEFGAGGDIDGFLGVPGGCEGRIPDEVAGTLGLLVACAAD